MGVCAFRKAGCRKGKVGIIIFALPIDRFSRQKSAAYIRGGKQPRFPPCTAVHYNHSRLAVIGKKQLRRRITDFPV